MCVLTESSWAVSNTRAYQSSLDVPPPPGHLITIVKRLNKYHTNNIASPTHQTATPILKSVSRGQSTCLSIRPSCVEDAHISRPPYSPPARSSPRRLVAYRSSCIVDVEVHLLLPPPLARYRASLPLRIHAVAEDAAIHHVRSDRVPPNLDIPTDCV